MASSASTDSGTQARVTILAREGTDPRMEAALREYFEVISETGTTLDETLAQHAQEIRGLITRANRGASRELIERLPRLEIIANFGVGYDSVDVATAHARGVVVTNTPGVLNGEMADFAIGLLLATLRRLPQADQHVRSGAWARGEAFPLARSLRGRSIGIAGMGRIGRILARRLEGFDLPIAYLARQPRPDVAYTFHASLQSLAEAVDTLIVLLPATAQTRHVIDAAVLEALGPQGVLINVSRGSVVDEQALIDALSGGKLLAAGLDVFEREPHVPEALLALENTVLLPHIGTATQETRQAMADLVVENVVSWFQGNGAITPVEPDGL